MAGSPTSNVASTANYRFILSNESKNIQYFCQEVSGLGMSLTDIPFFWFGEQIKRAGDVLQFNDLNLMVILDEEFLSFEESFNYITELRSIDPNKLDWDHLFEGVLSIYNNKNYLKKQFLFHNCWIREVGDLTFSTQSTEFQVITFPVTIAFDWYQINANASTA